MTANDRFEASDLQLRPAVSADLPEIAEVFLAARSAAVPTMPPLVQSREQVLDWVLGWSVEGTGKREVWLAEDGLEIAGYAVVTGDWLDSLYVAPARQGTGIGSALLDLVKSLRPGGFGLWAFTSNAPARAFYLRHGLIELESTDGRDNEERAPDVRMVWPGEDPRAYLRVQIDLLDGDLAQLLARRFALTAAVQGYKPRGGHLDRDLAREREIAERMAAHVPGLEVERVARVLDVIISEGLDRWEAHESGSGVDG